MQLSLSKYLKKTTEAAPLAVFRLFFGIMMFASIVRFWLNGWIEWYGIAYQIKNMQGELMELVKSRMDETWLRKQNDRWINWKNTSTKSFKVTMILTLSLEEKEQEMKILRLRRLII